MNQESIKIPETTDNSLEKEVGIEVNEQQKLEAEEAQFEQDIVEVKKINTTLVQKIKDLINSTSLKYATAILIGIFGAVKADDLLAQSNKSEEANEHRVVLVDEKLPDQDNKIEFLSKDQNDEWIFDNLESLQIGLVDISKRNYGFDSIHENIIVGELGFFKYDPLNGRIIYNSSDLKIGELRSVGIKPYAMALGTEGYAGFNLQSGEILWNSADLGIGKCKKSDELLIGEFGFARIDLKENRLIFSTEDLEIGKIALNNYDINNGIILGSNGVAKIDFNTGEVEWTTSDLGIGELEDRFSHIKNVNTPKEGKEVIDQLLDYRFIGESGVASIDKKTGEVLYTTNQLTDMQKAGLEELGITKFERFYSAEFVDHIIENRNNLDKVATSDRPIVLIAQAESDTKIIQYGIKNEAFTTNNYDQFMNQYNVIFYQISHEDTLNKHLEEIKGLGIHVSIAIIEGHSNPNFLAFNEEDPRYWNPNKKIMEEVLLDLSDEDELKQYADIFTDQIIISGCESGQGGADQKNIANMIFRSLGSKANKIISPTKVENYLMKFDDQGYFEKPISLYNKQSDMYVISNEQKNKNQ